MSPHVADAPRGRTQTDAGPHVLRRTGEGGIAHGGEVSCDEAAEGAAAGEDGHGLEDQAELLCEVLVGHAPGLDLLDLGKHELHAWLCQQAAAVRAPGQVPRPRQLPAELPARVEYSRATRHR